MKTKVFLSFLVIGSLFGCIGTPQINYSLPDSNTKFCVMNNTQQEISLNDEQKAYIINLLNNKTTWVYEKLELAHEFSFYTKNEHLGYSTNGIFSDFTNERFVEISLDEKETINSYLGAVTQF